MAAVETAACQYFKKL